MKINQLIIKLSLTFSSPNESPFRAGYNVDGDRLGKSKRWGLDRFKFSLGKCGVLFCRVRRINGDGALFYAEKREGDVDNEDNDDRDDYPQRQKCLSAKWFRFVEDIVIRFYGLAIPENMNEENMKGRCEGGNVKRDMERKEETRKRNVEGGGKLTGFFSVPFFLTLVIIYSQYILRESHP